MQVGILGPLVVDEAGHPVQIGGARLRSLLTRLAADPGRWVGTTALATALWPDDERDDAPADQANALQSLVSRLRRALPQPQLIESGPAGYRLAITDADLDATRFEQTIARARRELAAGRVEAAAAEFTAGLALWRGPALADVPPLPFATAWATRLEELRLAAIEDRVDVDLELRRATDLVAELEDLVTRHPLRERLHGQLMRVLARSGRQADALAAYERVRRTLADELGVDPSPALQAVHLAVLRGTESAPAQPIVVHHPRTNLRPFLTSFVGRENDVAQVTRALERSRLVTLIGAGGAGKTRLSAEVGLRVESSGSSDRTGSDGVWQVELAPVTDPAQLAAAALGALGALETTRLDRRQPARQDDLQRLADTVSDRNVLILLDNCEHVIDAAAKLAEQLLRQCPHLKVLATSREPLAITGESLWPVQPLDTPSPGDELSRLETTPSVRLFVDRATLVQPGFRLDDANAGAVTEICRRLDGLPLAIELAAARMRTMSPRSVADRLEDRFRLLTGGSRTAMPRHQTLRAVVAWSWELLTETERRLAERLSIFPGGATVEAGAAVAEPGGIDLDADVLDQLTTLADKSLLVPLDDSEVPRYRMLETIREFGSERLAERGEVDKVRAAYVRYFRLLAEREEPLLRGPGQLEAMATLNEERENLLTAIRFAADAEDADSAVRLGAALAWYWILLGRHDEATSMLGQVLAVPGDADPEQRLIAQVTYSVNQAATGQGFPTQETISQYREAVNRFDPLTSHPLIAIIKPAIAMLSDDRAGMMAEVGKLREHRDPWARAMLLMFDVITAENFGDLDRMREVLPEVLGAFRAIGDRWGTGTALGAVANLRALDGDLAGSVAALEEARELMGQLRATDDETYTLVRIGLLMLQLGQTEAGTARLQQGLVMATESGQPHSVGFAFFGQGVAASLRGEYDVARDWCERGADVIRNSFQGPPQVLGSILAGLSHIDLAQGQPERALRRLLEAWAPTLRSRDQPVISTLMTAVAEVISAGGDAELAARMVGAAQRVRGGPDLGDRTLGTLIATLQAKLGAGRFGLQVAGGLALSVDDAIQLASDWLGIDPGDYRTPFYPLDKLDLDSPVP